MWGTILFVAGISLTCASQSDSLDRCFNNTAHHSIPQICISPNTTATVTLPLASLSRYGQKLTGKYPIYITNDQRNTDWSTLVTDPPGYKWKSWSTTESSRRHRNIIWAQKSGSSLVLTIDLTKGNITKDGSPGCWGFLVWEWSSDKDRAGLISICQRNESKANHSISTPLPPSLSPAATKIGVKAHRGPIKTDDWFQVTTGVSGNTNNWLLLVENAGNTTGSDCVVCMGPRPLLQVVPAPLNDECFMTVMTTTKPDKRCADWDTLFPVTESAKQKPIFSSKIAPGNFTCVNMTGSGPLGRVNPLWCIHTYYVGTVFNPVPRADVWWWCGDDRLFDQLPRNVTGLCALITLLLPVMVIPVSSDEIVDTAGQTLPRDGHRRWKRELTWQTQIDPTYIDAIGFPRGVPDEYKLVDQVKAGFESFLCWWCTINKNVDRINYVHYNIQRLGNWTQSGFEAVHGQLQATSLTAFQNRIAVDMLLAEKGGVCAIFGDQCCTFIPNNTASDGSLTKALDGLRTLNSKMKDHSGVETSMWDSWMGVFGRYKALVSFILLSLAVFITGLTLCGCCCIPCIRALLDRLITTAIAPASHDKAHMFPLLPAESQEEDELDIRCVDPEM